MEEGLRNRVSTITSRFTYHTKFYCFFHILLVVMCINVYTVVCFACLYLILYITYSYCYIYIFLLLCMFRSRYCVSLCCSVYCLCVNVYCTTATGCQPNCSYRIYIISNNIISYRKTLSQCLTLFTAYITWTDLGWNPGLRDHE